MNQQRLIAIQPQLIHIIVACCLLMQLNHGQVMASGDAISRRQLETRPCSSCASITAINNTSVSPQLPQFIILGLQKWSSIVIKIYSTYQAEVTGVICVLKYYKLLNLPDSLAGLWELVNNYMNINNNSPSSSARTFFPFPEIDFEDKQQVSQETLSRCAQVYLFSFFVRALEDLL